MSLIRRAVVPLVIAMVVVALAIDVAHRTEDFGVDFHTYEAAAHIGVQFGWSHIYDQGLVAAEQKVLDPGQRSQPFLSPPPVAWMAAAVVSLPYASAFYVWSLFTLLAYAIALVWSATSSGAVRWIAIAAAIAPWWVLHAVFLGQVAPLLAAGAVVAWRLVREKRQIAAGLALSVVFLKPNTAFLIPIALLVAGRQRTFVTVAIAGAAVGAISLFAVGPHELSMYLVQLQHPPRGANTIALEGAFGVSGALAVILRLGIVAAALAAAYRFRRSSGLVVAVGILGSLLTSSYLHASDFCLLSAAAWIVWEERPAAAWRIPLAALWLLASPFVAISDRSPNLNRWPLVELAALLALVVVAWRVGSPRTALTADTDLRKQAPHNPVHPLMSTGGPPQ